MTKLETVGLGLQILGFTLGMGVAVYESWRAGRRRRRRSPDIMERGRNRMVYLQYLAQARESGLPPDGRRYDHPCDRFLESAEDLLILGYARRKYWLWGPLGITKKGCWKLIEIALKK